MSLRRPHTEVTPYLGAVPLAASSTTSSPSSPSSLRLLAPCSSATTLSRRISILRRRAARLPASPTHSSPFLSDDGDPAATSQQISAMKQTTDPKNFNSNQARVEPTNKQADGGECNAAAASAFSRFPCACSD
jgi:hypothetical protein